MWIDFRACVLLWLHDPMKLKFNSNQVFMSKQVAFFIVLISILGWQNCGELSSVDQLTGIPDSSVVNDDVQDDDQPNDLNDIEESKVNHSLMVVHCDPVTNLSFSRNFALLEELVKSADSYNFKLSIHFTLSFAYYSLQYGKSQTIKNWLTMGHQFGTHPHPEWSVNGRFVESGWSALPAEKVKTSIDQATSAVNQLVGEENNKILDTLSYLFSDAGSPSSLIPAQFTTLAFGNMGHPHRVPILLADNRRLTAYFYRGIPGFVDDNKKTLTARELIREATSYTGELLSAAIHPFNFSETTLNNNNEREETLLWMKWSQSHVDPLNLKANLDKDLSAPVNQSLRLTSSSDLSEDNEVQSIVITVDPGESSTTVDVLSYLPSGFHELDLTSVAPEGYEYDQEWGRISWPNQSLSSGAKITYSYKANRTNELNGNWHPTSIAVHSFVQESDSLGNPYGSRRWSISNDAGTISNAQGKRISSFDSLQ